MQSDTVDVRPARLSAAFVRTIEEPGRYGDGRGGFGLSLLVAPTATGRVSKRWAQRLRFDGDAFNVGLGAYPIVTLQAARDVAFANARAVRDGHDVRVDRATLAIVPTFADAVESTIATHAASWKDGGKTAKIWRSRLREYGKSIASKRVDAVTPADVLAVLIPLWADKRETARKLRQYIGAVMAWAMAQGYRTDNPAGADITAALPRGGNTAQHHRALPLADVPAALASIAESGAGATTKLALRFLTLTAARSGEVRGAAWAEIDQRSATWTIPAPRTKTGRAHRIPLTGAALETLRQASEYADRSGLIFPSSTGRMLSDATLSKLVRELGIAGTPHGMRATFRTWAAEAAIVPREVAEFALGHVEGSAAELAYRRTDYYEMRSTLMEAWADAIT